MNAAIVAAAIAALSPAREHRAHEVRARMLAPAYVAAAEAWDVDPLLLVALTAQESGFDVRRRGDLGELGLGQLLRGTMSTRGYDHLSDDGLMNPRLNLWLAARHMARLRGKCGGAPDAWLSAYSGRSCRRPSRYSRAIVARWEAVRAVVGG